MKPKTRARYELRERHIIHPHYTVQDLQTLERTENLGLLYR